MRIIRDLALTPPDVGPSTVALGVFDGVHLGHRSILLAAVEDARAGGLTAVACTFEPHPMQVLRPGRAPVPIATLDERLELIAAAGVDATVVLEFTPALAAVEAEAFVKDTLVGRLRAREVVVGYNHTFGRGARGDPRLLEVLGERLGFRARIVPPLLVDGVPVSSSEIRAALARADLGRAARMLGRDYTLGGTVVRGAGRGRTLGIPTANLAPDRPVLVPTGVYACRFALDGADHRAVVNVGVRPTFGEDRVVIEAHLLDFEGDLYDRRATLAFVARLREEQRFPSAEALLEQIRRDQAAARELLGTPRFTPPPFGGSLSP